MTNKTDQSSLKQGEELHFDWADLAFSSKRPINGLSAIFIPVFREVSDKRFTDLIKKYLPKGPIIVGFAKNEEYIDGFDGQPHFVTAKQDTYRSIIDKVNASSSAHKVYTLTYFQREATYIFEKLHFQKVVLINGSWKHSFHTLPAYYSLVKNHNNFVMESPFVDEEEAREYEKRLMPQIAKLVQKDFPSTSHLSEKDLFAAAQKVSMFSFDHTFQTGAALAKKTKDTYSLIACAYNKVVPYQTYAMLHGASREANFSPPNDLNHYDTVHAEIEILIAAQKQKLSLRGTSLFINLLPCPACSRMLCDTDIEEIVYSIDHSDGYAVKLLQEAGKTVRRFVP